MRQSVDRFVLIVEFQVKPECRAEFDRAIAVNAQASVRDEPGCRQFDVLRSLEDPNRVVLYEVYDDEAAFREDHMKRSHTQKFLGLAKELVERQTVQRFTRTLAPK